MNFAPNQSPVDYGFVPDNQVQMDSQLLSIDNKQKFTNKDLGKLLTDDMVRSYLNPNEMKAAFLFAGAYEAMVDANVDGKYTNAAESILAEFSVLINLARSRSGINVRVIKGRAPLEELQRKDNPAQGFKPYPQREQPNQMGMQAEPQYYPSYSQNNYR